VAGSVQKELSLQGSIERFRPVLHGLIHHGSGR